MFGEWKVQIVETPGKVAKRVYLMRFNLGYTEFITKDGDYRTIKEGEPIGDEPYFAEMTGEQLQAFANSLARNGVRTTNDSKNEGLLTATQAHLEDMRSLVFRETK